MKPHSRRLLLCVGIGVCILATGCGPSQPSTGRQPALSASPPTTALAPPTGSGEFGPDDRSLTSDEYLRLGAPADDRPWTSAEMTKVQKVLTDLAKKDSRQLPRYRSERSGKVFARLTDDENLGLARNATFPLSVRLSEILTYSKEFGAISKVYMAAFAEQHIGGREMVELTAHLFRVMVAITDVVDEYLPTIPKDDPDYSGRMAGFERMKQGAATSVNGALILLTERDAYSAPDRVRFAELVTPTLPLLVRRLKPGSRAEMVQTLETMNTDPKLKELQPALGKLRDAVRKAADE